jgi:hypothetical protein
MSHLGATKRLGLTGLIAVVLALSMTMFGALVSTASATRGHPHRLHAHAKHVRVTSFVYGHTASGKQVRGVFIPRSFMTSGNKLLARGVLKGKVVRPGRDRHFTRRGVLIPVSSVNGASAAPARSRANAAFPPAPGAGACNVLNLVLGPLDLNLLGLQVHLNQVVLNIVAQTGAGQLLGNLLCAVAGLLDPGPLSGLLTQLQALLNQILGALGGLRA